MNRLSMKRINTKALVSIAVLIAVNVILSRFLSIQTPIVRIGFGFLPIALAAMLYGPVYGGITAAAGDFIGATLFPTGAFFPGFTLTAFLSGSLYGFLLHKKPKSFARISLAVAIITIVLDLGLNTYWLHIIMGEAYVALLPARALKTVVIIPIQIAVIRLIADKLVLARFEVL